MAQVRGSKIGAVWVDDWALSVSEEAQVPENALATVSEGFCPNCLTPINKWGFCLPCQVYWSIWRPRSELRASSVASVYRTASSTSIGPVAR